MMCQMGHYLVSIQPTSQAASKVILLWPSRMQHDVVLTKMGLAHICLASQGGHASLKGNPFL